MARLSELADDDAPAMQAHQLATGGNKLLALTRPEDLRFLADRGSRRCFGRGDVLSEADKQADSAYFVERGIVSVVKLHDDDRRTEICLVGPEGFTGMAIVQADGRCPYEMFVQSEALSTFHVNANDLKELITASSAFHRTLLGAIHVQMVQIAENLASAVWQRTGVRLARWLLMYHDRVGSPQLEVTHEFMAIMIGAQRTKVTVALHDIEAAGAISATRGRVLVKDPATLERLANGTYGLAEQEADRLYPKLCQA